MVRRVEDGTWCWRGAVVLAGAVAVAVVVQGGHGWGRWRAAWTAIMSADDDVGVEARLVVDEASILPSLVLGGAGAVGGMASLILTYPLYTSA